MMPHWLDAVITYHYDTHPMYLHVHHQMYADKVTGQRYGIRGWEKITFSSRRVQR